MIERPAVWRGACPLKSGTEFAVATFDRKHVVAPEFTAIPD